MIAPRVREFTRKDPELNRRLVQLEDNLFSLFEDASGTFKLRAVERVKKAGHVARPGQFIRVVKSVEVILAPPTANAVGTPLALWNRSGGLVTLRPVSGTVDGRESKIIAPNRLYLIYHDGEDFYSTDDDRDRFDVTWFGARGNGVHNDQAAIQATDAAAALVGGTVYFPKGRYNAPLLSISSGVTWEGDGDRSVVLNCYLSATGTAGPEIAFTAPAVKGATSIDIPATGLTGAWLRLSSCINMQSPDAGIDQLGHDPGAEGFFGEYVQVLSGAAASATLSGALAWHYSNTPGADSGTFTTSVARVMSFHEGSRVRRLKFFGKNPTKNQIIEATFARDFLLEDVTLDCDDTRCQTVRYTYCFDCHVSGGTFVGMRNAVPVGSTANPIVFLSSQLCTVSEASIYYGNQGVDFDAYPNDPTYRGAPCIQCSVSNSRAFDCVTDGFTSHWGNYGSSFNHCTVRGSPRGIRLRDRGSRAQGCVLINGSGTGIGVFADNAAAMDAEILDNVCDGYLFGVQVGHGAAGYEALEALLGLSRTVIARNRIRNSADYGVYCSAAYASAVMVGPKIVDNEIFGSANLSIFIESYQNGAIVENNRIYGVPATKSGIRFGENIKRLHIGTNHVYGVNAAGFALQGSGVATFITDLATFPAGDAEAELYIGFQYTDAGAGFAFQSLIRNVAAFVAAKRHGYGPFASPLGTAGPTAERQTFGAYITPTADKSTLKFDTRDTNNQFTTHLAVIFGTTTPNGNVTASPGALYTWNNAGTAELWLKATGVLSNTGWVLK